MKEKETALRLRRAAPRLRDIAKENGLKLSSSRDFAKASRILKEQQQKAEK